MNAMKKVAHQMIATELTEAEIGHLQQQFRLLDTDGDGVITVGELMTAIAEIEATDSAGSSKALLRGLEASLSDSAHEDDAVLDIDEFIAATFRRHQGRKQKYSTRLQCARIRMCLTRAHPPCFENSPRAIDSSQNQPTRRRCDRAREF